ncbi:MAG: 30S ribosomal protein S7 [Candidatus Nealsonbacteria bacterium CG23_combo_of_CG06-09_8_20_14_all_40_13]|uniref:Small ribosomal subunit protein uS7 n=1 Tax=Candidatus Nealsonbacteria bacterium CG23_combo_of_CG06-09_8_20_14_all_40_13 TaxID=1974724 RepID=A0A2G9YR28_9BACT|nr:MAG: 30S ribosomal protein S7 [Candidatus Nealsonbacteria bacterium CG23_combo_of_CG06-09_8_20_14_all_40_13]PIR71183.1 MAG: 30S ribosomal protein S7 [Candidatus Nealsonbacteria bacterium CG10_big_fil_rev_8_21_14_0_10_40_24]PIU43604.1 MAG: 30S ribosomal protein S7 [Candidatus Nealsonbacteria bacterium CG07_land_8_20_14_0_80_40_10]
MSRGKSRKIKAVVLPDLKFRSILISQFINKLMISGKKEIAKKIVYEALDIASKNLKKTPLEVFEQAVKNASPLLEVRSRRIGGANYQIPMEVSPSRRMTLAMRWIIWAARDRQGKKMSEFLAQELIDTYNNVGSAVKKREEMHKMAEANRAFAHFARF